MDDRDERINDLERRIAKLDEQADEALKKLTNSKWTGVILVASLITLGLAVYLLAIH